MADEVWARDAVQNVLERRHKAGDDGMLPEDIQGEVAVGGDDLARVLGVMIEDGSARQDEEGRFEFIPEDERGERDVSELDPEDPDRIVAELDRPVPSGQVLGEGVTPGEREASRADAARPFMGAPVIRLTKGMITALSNEALGEVVKAAVAEHEESGAGSELTIAIA